MQSRLEYLSLLEQKAAIKADLPHLYGLPWYDWQQNAFESKNKNVFTVAANQIGKSTGLIRKCIHRATAIDEWPELWPTIPTQFWYFYPSMDMADVEFNEKWVKEFLPRGETGKSHPVYGWSSKRDKGKIAKLSFNSGVSVYFKSYEQRLSNLQASSVYNIFLDEECPVEYWDELNSRRSAAAVRGYVDMGFTATLGQEMWRQTMEPEAGELELFPDADKYHVSLYDCLFYADGSPGPWTKDMIEERKRNCKSEAEILRRIMGRFVIDENLKYNGFSRSRNYVEGHKLPKGWTIWTGVDIGGGGKSHPAGIIFVAVNPKFTAGRVFKGWRGDLVETTAADILSKYRQMKQGLRPVGSFYDWQSKDFGILSRQAGEPFRPADKSQALGEDLLNTLFKNSMLKIYKDPELHKLVIELEALKRDTAKRAAKDDLIDALRFAISQVPWDFTDLEKYVEPKKKDPYEHMDERERMRRGITDDIEGLDLFTEECEVENEAYEYLGYEDY